MSVAIEYPHRLAGHCASGAFRDLFEYRGYLDDGRPLSEAMIFGLGAGLDLMFLPQPAPRMPFYLGGRGPRFEESLIARIGGSITRRSEPDSDAAWAWVRDKLDRGEPVPMVGDCQKLEYLHTRTSMPQHVIVATGYDDTHALIADNDREQIQRCSLASLREARAATGFPLPAMNVTFEIDWPAAIPALDALILPAIAETVRWMRHPDGIPVMLFGRHSFGLAAMERLAHAARSWLSQGVAQPTAHATMLWIAIEKGGTGGGLFRRLYRDFLAEAHDRVPSLALARARDHYAQLERDWTAVGRTCGAGRFDGVARQIIDLVEAEREGVERLAEI